MLAAVRRGAVLVPATTRTPAQYARVELPGGPAPVRGREQRRAHRRRRSAGPPAGGARSSVGSPSDGAALAEIVGGWTQSRRAVGAQPQGRRRPVLLPGRRRRGDCRRHSWATGPAWCADRGWVVSMQGRKIYALPGGLTKEAALAEVMRRVGGTRLLAAGDGALDAGMLRWRTTASGRRTASWTKRDGGAANVRGRRRRSGCSRARRSSAGWPARWTWPGPGCLRRRR